MRGVFRLDSPLMTAFSKIFDCIVVSILWFFCSLPIITLAASTHALYVTMQRCIVKDEGVLLQTYWDEYRHGFWQGIAETVLFEIILFPFMLLIIWGNMNEIDIPWFGAVLLALGIIGLAAIQTAIYVFTIMYSLSMSFIRKLEFGFVLAIRHEKKSLLMIIVLAVSCVIIDFIPYLTIILPAAVIWIYGRVLMNVEKKYPEIFVVNDNSEELE